jgi:hypothetical protein
MEPIYKTGIWQQFGAAIDMFENAVRACPDELWQVRMWPVVDGRPELAEFWYITYHTLFWLDLYLFGTEEGFTPPTPFTLDELDPAGLIPERVYSKAELLDYLAYGRRKCQTIIAELTAERAQQICPFPRREMSFAELLLYNMRHVQEHGAQLSMVLGQGAGLEARWVAKAKS